MNRINIGLQSVQKGEWLKAICIWRNELAQTEQSYRVYFQIGKNIATDDLMPMHLVTYACLIHALKEAGHSVYQGESNKIVDKYIYDDLGFRHYWHDNVNYVETSQQDIFNLWRIKESEKDLYAKRVEEYFKKTFFEGKDLSFISSCMTETYYNIFDHADAGDNAYSFIKYNRDKKLLHVAVCDFGKGIIRSVMDFDSTITDDKEALKKAVENNFTTKSTDHNKGKGLDNLISQASKANILSGKAMLYKRGTILTAYDLDFDFKGTLIYFDIDLNALEDDEMLEEFSF
ncbi:MAG: ATP-binding protein [Bacteroidales bacterium]|nr:ATP-binding protein [Bacteroidales bacterium]